MEHIVVGVDESSSAGDALRWAVRERALRDARLSAVLVWTYLGQHHRSGDDVFQPKYGQQDAVAALAEFVKRTVPDEVDLIDQVVVCDLPSRGLLDASAGADLLVIGSRGLGGFRGALLGSVSQQLAHHATTPLAIIRAGSAVRDRAERVVVGVDGSEGSRLALGWALDAARVRGAHVTVVNSWEPPALAMVGLAAIPEDDRAGEAEARRLVEDSLAEVDANGLTDAIEIRTVKGSPAAAILDAAESATLVVVGTRGLGGFHGLLLGSVSQHVIHHADCPVVVVPPPRRAELDEPDGPNVKE
jgi:nucleotide-binding universal stress UspA family protein